MPFDYSQGFYTDPYSPLSNPDPQAKASSAPPPVAPIQPVAPVGQPGNPLAQTGQNVAQEIGMDYLKQKVGLPSQGYADTISGWFGGGAPYSSQLASTGGFGAGGGGQLASIYGPAVGGAAGAGAAGAGGGGLASVGGFGAGGGGLAASGFGGAGAGGAGAGGAAAGGPIGLAILAGILAQKQKAKAKPGSSTAKFWESVAPSPLTAIQEGNLIGSIPAIGPWLSPSKTSRTDSGQTFEAMGK